MIAELIEPRNQRWQDTLSRADHDIYHLPGYVSLSARYESGSPLAFYAEDDGAVFLSPLVVRRIPGHLDAPGSWFDAATPYGYPTPVLWPHDDYHMLERFMQVFRETLAEHAIVTAFFRLHPLMTLPEAVLAKYGTLVKHGQTVYIDLSESEEDFWAHMDRTHRKDIRRLIKSGFEAVIDDWSRYDDFLTIYSSTMRRLSATEFYAFPKAYFDGLRALLGDKLHLCSVVSPDGDTAAVGLYTTYRGIVQYHLSGTADAYVKESPSKLACEAIFSHAKKSGNRVLHLGGGVGGHNDSLFRFKAGFSQKRADFYTLRMILDEHKHATLTQLWHDKHVAAVDSAPSQSFFPIYRQLAEPRHKTA